MWVWTSAYILQAVLNYTDYNRNRWLYSRLSQSVVKELIHEFLLIPSTGAYISYWCPPKNMYTVHIDTPGYDRTKITWKCFKHVYCQKRITVLFFREGFNKKTLKVMEFSIQILPPPHPPSMEKTHFLPTIFLYVFIMFIFT